MPWRSLLVLPLLAAALPATAQTKLAQQCAAFGEAQYRKLSPSIDRVTALDFPPPALERVDAKVGSQAIAAALTLRGRLTYRSGSPFETQFVCLLDAGHRPIFFYALPTLATRSAPTPVTRGAAPAPVPPLQPPTEAPTMALGPQAALPAPEPPRPALPASAVRLRGLARDLGGRLQFLPCDGAPLPLEDRTPDQELTQALRGLTAGQNGRPMFVEIYGGRETRPGSRRSAPPTGPGTWTGWGIPASRPPGGFWTRYKPIYFDDFMASDEMRRESWRRKFATDETMLTAEPNAGHRALAKLVEQGRMSAIITQNVDGLHQRSGVPDSKIIELHGNATYASCLDCGHRHELDPIRKAFLGGGKLPLCVKCDGIVKTATISFGQAMPEIQMARAQDETMNCDLFIVLGSSLVVYPAAGFPRIAKRKGAKLIILNRDSTDQDDDADLVIHAEIGPTMSKAVGVN